MSVPEAHRVSEIAVSWLRPFRMLRFDLRQTDALKVNPKGLVAQAIAYGANVLVVSGGGIVAWYPTQLPFQAMNEFLGGDLLGMILKESHRQGVRVLVRLDVSQAHEKWLAVHPEWFQRTADGEARYAWTMPLTCLNGPYWQEHNLALVGEIMGRYKVDGFYYSAYRHSHCLCSACREAFYRATGLALPEREDWDDATWQALVRWRYDQVTTQTARLRDHIRQRDPRAILAVAFRLSADDPRSLREAGWLGPQLAKSVDLITMEACDDLERSSARYGHRAGEQARMARTFGPNQPTCVMLNYADSAANRRSAQPAARLVHGIMQVAAHGGQPCVVVSGALEQDDRKGLAAVKDAYGLLRDHAAIYEDLHSPARVALLYSQTTMDRYGRHDPARRCLAEYRGFYEMLSEGHVQFDVLHDIALAQMDLSRYDVLLLPNVAALDQEQLTCIDGYARDGGRVIASYETSLYDRQGTALASFALQCLGRRLLERREGHGSYLRRLNKELLPGLSLTDLVPLDGDILSTAATADSTSVVQDLTFVPFAGNNIAEYAYWQDETTIPGLTVSPFGRGGAALLPWEIGRLYYAHGVPECRQVLLDLLARWTEPLVRTNAPGSVEVTLYYPRGEPGRALVHLLNSTGWQSKPLSEVIPLWQLDIWIRGEYEAAKDLASGKEIAVRKEGGGTWLAVERLDGFVAIELVALGVALSE